MPLPIVKRIRLALADCQSNEKGAGQFQEWSRYGAPYNDGTGSNVGSWWGRAVDYAMVEAGLWIDVANTAIDGSGVVRHWCGDPSGIGTGTPYAMSDGGFDPNGYLADALAAATAQPDTHEAWVYMSNGQEDSSTTTLETYQLGLQNTIDYFLANDVKVMLGFTCYFAGQASWFENVGTVAVNNILANYSGSDVVKAGANLYEELGTGIQFWDGTHMTERSYELSGDAVGVKLVAAVT